MTMPAPDPTNGPRDYITSVIRETFAAEEYAACLPRDMMAHEVTAYVDSIEANVTAAVLAALEEADIIAPRCPDDR